MFSAVLFAEDQWLAKAIEQAAIEYGGMYIYKTVQAPPSLHQLLRLLNGSRPDIVLVQQNQLDTALALARDARAICPDTAGVVVAPESVPEQLLVEATNGALEILTHPLTGQRLREAVEQAIRKARKGIDNNILGFLPAKAGSGSTTIALNIAACLARDLAQRVLVLEADLRSGLISVLLHFSPERTILDALNQAVSLDDLLWDQIVSKAHGLDILPTPRPTEATAVSWTGYHQVLQFARPRYDAIVIDLPELINDATLEVVRRARKIFVITTAELPSLVLTRQRLKELAARGIAEEFVGVVVNRWTNNEISVTDVTQFLDFPVSAVFQNDYRSVRRAIHEGRPIGKSSELGRSLSGFAAQLIGAETPPAREPARTFFAALMSRQPCATR